MKSFSRIFEVIVFWKAVFESGNMKYSKVLKNVFQIVFKIKLWSVANGTEKFSNGNLES